MKPQTQEQRVLRALERRGSGGITAIDFMYPSVIDGGNPVLRLPSRIDDLRRRGHRITSRIERVGSARLARYRLVALASAVSDPDPAVGDAEPEALVLDIDDPGRRPRSPLDPEMQ